jgi:Protein kinase domain
MRLAYNQMNRKAVEDEIKAVTLLCRNGHPNIIEVIDHGQLSIVNHYIDMELCDISLADLLKRPKRKDGMEDWYVQWPIEKFEDRLFFILALMQELSNGLYFIHGHDQVHRDIKPENGMCFGFRSNLIGGSALLRPYGMVEAHRLWDNDPCDDHGLSANRRIALYCMLRRS